MWHNGLILKLQTYGIDGNLLKLLQNCLKDRQLKVILIGEMSSWKIILTGFPQESVFGSLLFPIYIKNLPEGVTSLCKIFADDTFLFFQAMNRKYS